MTGVQTCALPILLSVANSVADENYFVVRVDHNLTAKDSLFARYIRDTADVVLPLATSPIPLYPQHDLTNNQFATLEWKRLISPTVVNLARTSFLRPTEQSVLPNSIPALSYFSGRPDGRVLVNGLSQVGPVQDDPFRLYVNHYVVGDDVIWSLGAHSLRMGANLDRTQDNTVVSAGNGGAWTFNSLLQFLQGTATQLQAPPVGFDDTTRDMRELFFTPYVQDEWKVLPRLTLNLGLRYEWNANPSERLNKLTNFVELPTGSLQKVPNAYARNPSKNNWAPRVGFAWDVQGNGRTAVRGGFGIFHQLILGNYLNAVAKKNPPYAATIVVTGQPAQAITVANSQAYTAQVGPSLLSPNLSPTLVDALAEFIQYNLDPSYDMKFNLSLDRELLPNLALSMQYVGSQIGRAHV